jgi:hypothetical protein
MDEMDDFPGMVPYPLIFPEAEEGVVGVTLPRKVGKARAGEYSFIEAYCVEEDCDCRRVALLVVNEKRKQVATIEFGFDPEHPLAGPFLDEFEKQAAGAGDLLQVFVDLINKHPEWLKGMYRHYKDVRRKVDGRTYRGKPFPKPGAVERVIKPPEEDNPFEDFQSLLEAAARTAPAGSRRKKGAAEGQGSLFPEEVGNSGGMAAFIERYRELARSDAFTIHRDLQSELRRYLLERGDAGDELAALLPGLLPQAEKDEEHFDAALRVLFDALEILRVELERKRPGAAQRMERWQDALARHVFAEGSPGELCSAVTQMLLNARVEILPRLHEASSRRILTQGEHDLSLRGLSEEEVMSGLFRSFEELEIDSPFEMLDAFLQMMAVGDAQVQVALCGAMFSAENPLIRETAALMLFHPQAEVRAGVAQVLAEVDGRCLTPATLRRLIVARNWFPESLRGLIDQAIANARRARVECAPLPRRVEMTVHASAVDGAMAQTFQVVVPEGKGFLCCSIMPKRGAGVADAFLIPLAGKRERSEFLAMLRRETGAVEVSADYLHRRICQTLADGTAHGKVPCHWLVAIAERLGCDQWKAVPFDPHAELAVLRAEIERRGGRFVAERYRLEALEASGDWPEEQPFARSWFEDDAEVDDLIRKVLGKKRRPDPERCIAAILEKILQPRRAQWLERLVLAALWLRAAKTPPVPWEQMFHVAEAVADETAPLAEIPLMVMIAGHSFGAFLGRQEG